MLDPQASILPNVNPSNPGKIVDWIANPGITTQYTDQFAPYNSFEGFDVARREAFQGTLFRLPLRTQDQAASSLLSKRALSIEETLALLQSLQQEASSLLLFLKNIQEIEIGVWLDGQTKPSSLFHCHIANINAELIRKRHVMSMNLRSLKSGIETSDYTLQMSCTSQSPSSSSLSAAADVIHYEEIWELSNQLGSRSTNAMALDSSNSLLRLIPWGGVAARVRSTNPGLNRSSQVAYCFLPLPIDTNLPVMVNGFFELSSNRRDVWQAGSDMTGDGQKRAQWNILLMREIIGPSYVRLIKRIQASMGWGLEYQSFWPSLRDVPSPWNIVAEAFYEGSREENLLMYEGNPGSWIPTKSAILIPDEPQLQSSLSANKALLVDFLRRSNVKVVDCLPTIRSSLLQSKVCSMVADPSFVRTQLRQYPIKSSVNQKDLIVFLSSYCLMGVNPRSNLEDIDMLSLLPTTHEHRVGFMRVFNAEQLDALNQILGMGFAYPIALSTLAATKFDLAAACDRLLTSKTAASASLERCGRYYLVEEEEANVFREASEYLLDNAYINGSIREFYLLPEVQEKTNIKAFNKAYLLELLSGVLPRDPSNNRWLDVSLSSMKDADKIRCFIDKFWKYLSHRDHYLDALANGPAILPVEGGRILALAKDSCILVTEANESIKLSVEVEDAMRALQMNLASTSIVRGHNQYISHKLWQYVHAPDRKGILEIFTRLINQRGSAVFDEQVNAWTENQRDHMLMFLSSEAAEKISSSEADIIRLLPIFKVYDASRPYTKLQGSEIALQDHNHLSDKLYPSHMLCKVSDLELKLYRKLGVKVMKKSAFFQEVFFPNALDYVNLSFEDYTTTLLHMFTILPQLIEEDAAFVKKLVHLSIIPSSYDEQYSRGDGIRRLHACSELFDPTIAEYSNLLGDDLFPAKALLREDILLSMRSVGLQTTMQWPSIIACARGIERQYKSNPSSCIELTARANNLLSFLDKNIDELLGFQKAAPQKNIFGLQMHHMIKSLFTNKSKSEEEIIKQRESYIAELVSLEWIPVLDEPLDLCTPWPTSNNSHFAAAMNTRLLQDAWYCSATYRLSTCNPRSPRLITLFRWDAELDPHILCNQLKSLSKMFYEHQSSSTSAMVIPQFQMHINEHISNLYHRLNNVCDAEICSMLQDVQWLWVGDAFVLSERVAMQTMINAAPYLYPIPQEMRLFTNLIKTFHIKAAFTSRDYVGVLSEMAARHERADDQTGAIALDDGACDLAVSLVTMISNEGKQFASAHRIYLPDNSNRLRLASELIYDDIPWSSEPAEISYRAGCKFTHRNIAFQVASNLGVQSLRQLLLMKNVEQDLFKSIDDESRNIESFGQTESVTNRLKGILDLYPDGNPILSELIQNADDSGATTVKIMLDHNTYNSTSLLDSKLDALQGPSLLVYNDAAFSEDDFRALAKIGQGSKVEKLATTGRFGLGFSSTYHLTDTPSFASNDYLVILDPHCAYVPSANNSQPGVRINFKESSLPKTFHDQFEPFRFFDCDFKSTYHSTLFRFPLRTQMQARKSEISKRFYTSGDIKELLENLAKQLSQHMLFLRHITIIEIYECDVGSRVPRLTHRAQAKSDILMKTGDDSIFQFFNRKESARFTRDMFYSKLLSIADANLPQTCSDMHIDVTTYPILSSIDTASADVLMAPVKVEEFSYLVVSGLRGGEAKRMACDEKVRHLKLIPLGSVAVCLTSRIINNNDQIGMNEFLPAVDGLAFCFLPLPIHSHLPVHLNAYWELSSNRRDIWRGSDLGGEAKLRSDWNVCVMENILSPLYVQLLKSLLLRFLPKGGNPIDDFIKKFYQMLPSPIPPQPWDIVARSTLRLLQAEKILWSGYKGGQLVLPRDAVLLADATNPNLDVSRIYQLLVDENVIVSKLLSSLLESFTNAQCKNSVVSPAFIRRWFNTKNFQALEMDSATNNTTAYAWVSRWKDMAADNAIFLLKYAIQDIQRSNYAELDGLALLPLENGSIASLVIKDEKNQKIFYIVDEKVRKLLQMKSSELVVSGDILGPNISIILSDPHFAEIFNVCHIRPSEVFDLIQDSLSGINGDWETKLVRRSDLVSNEWLCLFWQYVIDGKHFGLVEKRFPFMPVLRPLSCLAGNYAVCLSPETPILHMMFSDLPPLIIDLFAKIGIYVVDSSILGSQIYAQDILDRLQLPSANGLMNALVIVSKMNQTKTIVSWSDEATDSFRDFILDHLINKLSDKKADDVTVLRNLRIWRAATSANVFSALNPHFVLPPSSLGNKLRLKQELLGERYVHLRSESDRILYRQLDVEEQSLGSFYVENIIPRIQLGDKHIMESIDSIVVEILLSLSRLEADNPGICKALSSIAMIRCEGGNIMAAKDLFDPAVPELTRLLPRHVFPKSSLFLTSQYLNPLRTIGLQTHLQSDGILVAAKTIHSELLNRTSSTASSLSAATGSSDFAMGSDIDDLISRGKRLFEHIEKNIESLLTEVDPENMNQLMRHDFDENSLIKVDLGGAWAKELRSLSWIPVFIDIPSRRPHYSIDTTGLPWPSNLHSSPLASPSQCILLDDIWSSSSNLRVTSCSTTQSLTRCLLGWNKPVAGKFVAQQLLEMRNIFYKTDDLVQKQAIIRTYQAAVAKVYQALFIAYKTETDLEVSTWINLLRDKAIVWTNDSFVEPNRISFRSLSATDMKPYLFIIPSEWLPYRLMFGSFGVRDCFEPHDVADLIRHIKGQYEETPLPVDKLHLCLGIVQLLISFLQPRPDDQPSAAEPDLILAKAADESAVAESEDFQVNPATTISADQVHLHPVITLSELGEIYLPNHAKVLVKASQLLINDAPWLNAGRSRQMNFVHPDIDSRHATLLGCKSLRDHLFSGSEVLCPTPQTLARLLSQTTLEAAIFDLISYADAIQGNSVHIFYDQGVHPSQSLMNPHLEIIQGPALSLMINGPTLSSEKLHAHLTAQDNSVAVISSTALNTTIAEPSSEATIFSGNKLLSAFAISDVVQVLSGRELFIYDPLGSCLKSSSQLTDRHTNREMDNAQRPIQIAQKCHVFGDAKNASSLGDQDILAKFPDQLSPFMSLSAACATFFNGKLSYPGVIIRMPLRAVASVISPNESLREDISVLLRSLMPRLKASLAFSDSIVDISSFMRASIDLPFSALYQISLCPPIDKRSQRKALTIDKTWKKQGLSTLFSKAFVPTEVSYSIKLSISEGAGEVKPAAQRTEIWVLWSTFGQGRTRLDAMMEPLAAMNVQPLVTIACPYLTQHDLRDPPAIGYLYHQSSPLMLSGLPFHVEGSFFKLRSTQSVPLAEILSPSTIQQNITSAIGLASSSSRSFDVECCRLWNTSLLSVALDSLIPKALNDLRAKIAIDAKKADAVVSVDSLYLYWPYLPRMSDTVKNLAVSTKMIPTVCESPMFLCQGEYRALTQALLRTDELIPSLKSLFESYLTVSSTPIQIGIDLKRFPSLPAQKLSPTLIRDFMKKEAIPSDYLDTHRELLFPLLSYCLSDLLSQPNDSLWNRQRSYSYLQGCRLFLMADGKVRPFPRNPRERVIHASVALHGILQKFASSFIHPLVFKVFPQMADEQLMSSLHIHPFSIYILEDYLPLIFPDSWKRCLAISWLQGRGSSNVNLESCLYVLWKEILSKETLISSFDSLKAYPIVPVISGQERILLSADFLPYLFIMEPTEEQNIRRERIAKSVNYVAINQMTEAEKYVTNYGTNIEDLAQYCSPSSDYAWMSEPAREIRNSSLPTLATSAAIPFEASRENQSVSAEDGSAIAPVSESTGQVSDTTAIMPAISQPVEYVSNALLGAVRSLGLPIIDGSVFESVPELIKQHPLDIGRRLLLCIHMLSQKAVTIYTDDSSRPLLQWESIAAADRKTILLEIFKSHRDRAFNASDIDKLKQIPLFISIDNLYVTPASYTSIYWCISAKVIETVAATMSIASSADTFAAASSAAASSQTTVLLQYDADLIEIYKIIGAEELTASKSASKFIAPVLQRARGKELTTKMIELAENWGTYSNDADFKAILKNLAFIPTWSPDSDLIDYTNMRTANQTISWLNSELMDVLQGPGYERFYAPPYLQTARNFAMFSDLDMMTDINKATLLAVASSIRDQWLSIKTSIASEYGLIESLQHRARQFLRYMNENGRLVGLLATDSSIAAELKTIEFIPAQVPTAIESGGYVVMNSAMVRYQDLVTKACGSLVFSLIPVLAEDIAPPQMFLSSLGVMTSPSHDLVTKHLLRLTRENGAELLDRWNLGHLYSIKATFQAIFDYLADHWRELAESTRALLQSTSIIPVGNLLVRPQRLFWKLPVDLSPFLHEVPLHFGSHEQILKRLGVRASPQIVDYVNFLESLAYECKDASLNTNELRAVKSIVDAIISVDTSSINSSSERGYHALYLPDENSILRVSSSVLYSDNQWLRSQIMMLEDYGYSILHPMFSADIALQLNIRKLSELVQERLLVDDIDSMILSTEAYESQAKHVKQMLLHEEVIHALVSLLLHQSASSSMNESLTANHSAVGSQHLRSLLAQLELVFVSTIPSHIVIQSSTSSMVEIATASSYPVLSYLFTQHQVTPPRHYLLLNSSQLSSHVPATMMASIGICKYIGLHEIYASVVGTILSGATDSSERNTGHILSSLQLGTDPYTIREKTRGIPGENLSPIDRQMLQLKPFKSFQIGEIVAVGSTSSDAIVTDDVTALRYAKVISIGEASESGIRKISVKLGADVCILLSSSVYSFRSARDGKVAASQSTFTGTEKARQPSLGSRNLQAAVTTSPTATASAATAVVATSDASLRVSNADVLEGIESLLGRAGIPKDLDRRNFISRILELESEAENTKKVAQRER
jgi:hypothetical protein